MVADAHQEAVQAVVGAADDHVRKHYRPVRLRRGGVAAFQRIASRPERDAGRCTAAGSSLYLKQPRNSHKASWQEEESTHKCGRQGGRQGAAEPGKNAPSPLYWQPSSDEGRGVDGRTAAFEHAAGLHGRGRLSRVGPGCEGVPRKRDKCLTWMALLVIQYFWASVVGVLMMNCTGQGSVMWAIQ